MIKRFAISGLVLWLLSQAGVVLGEAITSSEYFPLDDGNYWTYRVTDSQAAYYETITVLPGTTIIDGLETKAKQDSIGNTGYFTSDNNGIKVYRYYFPYSQLGGLTVNFNPPLIEARGTMSIPSTVSSSGIAELIYDDYGTWPLEYEYASKFIDKQTIQVPAGTYETIRTLDTLRTFGNLFGHQYDETETDETWSARYIGVVKNIETDSDGREESVLTKTNVKRHVRYLPFLPLLLD